MLRMVCRLLQSSGLDEENLLVQKHAPQQNMTRRLAVCKDFQGNTKDTFLLYFLLLY
jgi:hypothetical protein